MRGRAKGVRAVMQPLKAESAEGAEGVRAVKSQAGVQGKAKSAKKHWRKTPRLIKTPPHKAPMLLFFAPFGFSLRPCLAYRPDPLCALCAFCLYRLHRLAPPLLCLASACIPLHRLASPCICLHRFAACQCAFAPLGLPSASDPLGSASDPHTLTALRLTLTPSRLCV